MHYLWKHNEHFSLFLLLFSLFNMRRSILILAASLLTPTSAFAPPPTQIQRRSTAPLSLSLDDATQSRIQTLVDENPVLLFMKGTKLFPQCGFSNTACQILQSYNIDFETVDVLADENIRQGVKVFSDWPTIPQLYVCGEFVGGSDIMIEMYQSGELGEMIEKVSVYVVVCLRFGILCVYAHEMCSLGWMQAKADMID
jgi:monothiol glutaredoxin